MDNDEFYKQRLRVEKAATLKQNIESWKSRRDAVICSCHFQLTNFIDCGARLDTGTELSMSLANSWVPLDKAKEVFDFAKRAMVDVCDEEIAALMKQLEKV